MKLEGDSEAGKRGWSRMDSHRKKPVKKGLHRLLLFLSLQPLFGATKRMIQ